MENADQTPDPGSCHAFSNDERAAVYKAITTRRDVRSQFQGDAVPDEVLARILTAAHHAPSVGFMQPWNFLLVRSAAVKQRVHDAFNSANEEARLLFADARRELYSSLKLQGIVDAPITFASPATAPVQARWYWAERICRPWICIAACVRCRTCGWQHVPKGWGVGWVSIFHEAALQDALGIPQHIVPIAYLCIGYVSEFNEQPDLEKAGWLPRLPIEDLVFQDQWGMRAQDHLAEETEGITEDSSLASHLRNIRESGLCGG